jgi:FdrA protein
VSWHVRVIANRYADSVRLMAVARGIRERPDVDACVVAMGTPANLAALAELGAVVEAQPGDLVLAVRAQSAGAAQALAAAEESLASIGDDADTAAAPRPRSLDGAVRELAGANVALISVPGEYATLEAQRALSEDMHVFLFSDHVPLEDERELKRRGARLGLLVMGPECGTSMLGGVGLGFANVVRPGRVGIVAAAGSGAQETACLLDRAGVGVSQIIGVGGRDLSAEVGGLMFRQGIRMLAEDPGTDTLLLVSKPPAADVVRELGEVLPDDMRAVAAFVGWEGDEQSFEVHRTLEGAALAAAGAEPASMAVLRDSLAERRHLSAGRALLGLFSGGSLAHEATTILEPELGPLGGNVGQGPTRPGGHAVFDLGAEEYTRGVPHPMVDLDVRLGMLDEAGANPRIGCVLLDVVLGHGAHPDPASELAPAVERATRDAVVIAHVCGTEADPQDAGRQEDALAAAGALLSPSNAAAARLALEAVR